MANLTAGTLAMETATTVAERIRTFGAIMLMPVVIAAVLVALVDVALPPRDGINWPGMALGNIITLCVTAPAMAAWARACAGHDSPADLKYRVGPAEIRFLRYAFMFLGILILLTAVMMVSAQREQGMLVMMALGGTIGFLVILPRLLLVLPAAALGRADLTVGDMIRKTEGNMATLAFAFALVAPPLLAIEVIGVYFGAIGAASFGGDLASSLWSALCAIAAKSFMIGVLIALSVRAYSELVETKGSASP